MARGVLIPVSGPLRFVKAETLEDLQQLVGGYIEYVSISPGHHAYIHEEGKLVDLPVNERATELWANPFDIIVGPMVILGDGPEGEEADIKPKVVQALQARGWTVEATA